MTAQLLDGTATAATGTTTALATVWFVEPSVVSSRSVLARSVDVPRDSASSEDAATRVSTVVVVPVAAEVGVLVDVEVLVGVGELVDVGVTPSTLVAADPESSTAPLLPTSTPPLLDENCRPLLMNCQSYESG